jgi:3-oxoacyl-[acyl-carrier protein] reductase
MSQITFDFTGRTVLVTGAAQGIGHAIATLFHESGASIAVADRNGDVLADAWSDDVWPDDDRIHRVALDVSDTGAVADAVAEVAAWGPSGSVDVVVNNAGITRDRVVWKLTDDDWNDVLGVHLTGTFATTRAVVPLMRERGFGRIINVTSFTGLHGNIGQANYAAAKAGIIGFTRTTAKELATFGITVNAISPNASTAMVQAIPADRLQEITATIPMRRFGEPAEMAPAVAFLASEDAGYITGIVLPVDGGIAI